ncbi:hypothetical protein ABID58_007058 [Bradyrhizobium sp. S3.2.6]|uniref:Alpha/beta hydrolase n=1 Tax=Bradyrhizobium japonicum TaxID=375 RepID=A0A1Y2JU76_BRAJP|nr:hypothetical protein [Bradyrhizobium japonicum]OSJ34124.1 hypothetical protein BSZ19_13245 [Bradyrhizobium japonicum]
MEQAFWRHVRGDLSSARRGAAAFLDSLPVDDSNNAKRRQDWIAEWRKIGDEHYNLGDLNLKKKAFGEAAEAWLYALTAFEIARRLIDEDDLQGEDISSKVNGGIRRFESSKAQKLERVKIPCCDQTELEAFYLRSGGPHLPTSAVMCISMEDETAATLLGRLLPAVIGRSMSVLVLSHDDVSRHSRGQSETLLSSCLDYLAVRPDVDANRIAIYGEGLSAALATEFAVSDHRLAAAVCDGGLWKWARILASVGWMTRTTNGVPEQGAMSARRSQIIRRLRCPVLVVAGGRGIVSVSEAIKLQADCMAERIDLELALPRMIRSLGADIENFVTSDDCIFGWLEQKLHTRCSSASVAAQRHQISS